MTKCHHETSSFSNCRKRQVKENFAGGSISSNGGALLLREVDRRIGLTAKVARALGDRRQRGKVLHGEILKRCSSSWARNSVSERVPGSGFGCSATGASSTARTPDPIRTRVRWPAFGTG